MNKQEQQQKLWCDVYLRKYIELLNADDCAKYANEAVKAFDEAFGDPNQTEPKLSGGVKEQIFVNVESGVYLTREEADWFWAHVPFNMNLAKLSKAKELLKIKP